MFVLVDLTGPRPAVTLEEPADCTRFHVQANGARDPSLLATALSAAGAGRMKGEDALVSIDAVRAMASGRVGDGWAADFAKMLDYARGKGWLDDAGDAIQAHVEWQSRERNEAPPSAARPSGSVSDPLNPA